MLLGFCIFCLCHIFGQIWFLFVQVCLCWIYYFLFMGLCVFLCLSLWLLFGSLLGLCKCIYCMSLSICLSLSFAMSMPAILLGLWGYLCGPPLLMCVCIMFKCVWVYLMSIVYACRLQQNLINLEFFWKDSLDNGQRLIIFFHE